MPPVFTAGHSTVLHILGPKRADPHELDPNARLLPGGRLVYAGPAGK